MSLSMAIRKDLIIALSFGVTIFRVLLIVVASVLIFANYELNTLKIVFLIFLIMHLDYLDGVLFRKSPLHSIQNLRIQRRLIDSISDRIVTHVGCLSLLIVDSNFILVYSAILFRDIIISGYNIFVKTKFKTIIYPGALAKLGAFSVGLSVITYLLADNNLIVFSTTLGMMIISVFSFREYLVKFYASQLNKENSSTLNEIF